MFSVTGAFMTHDVNCGLSFSVCLSCLLSLVVLVGGWKWRYPLMMPAQLFAVNCMLDSLLLIVPACCICTVSCVPWVMQYACSPTLSSVNVLRSV